MTTEQSTQQTKLLEEFTRPLLIINRLDDAMDILENNKPIDATGVANFLYTRLKDMVEKYQHQAKCENVNFSKLDDDCLFRTIYLIQHLSIFLNLSKTYSYIALTEIIKIVEEAIVGNLSKLENTETTLLDFTKI